MKHLINMSIVVLWWIGVIVCIVTKNDEGMYIILALSPILKELMYVNNWGGIASKQITITPNDYRLNTCDKNIIMPMSGGGYIVKKSVSPLWKYSIEERGVIFKWDKRSKQLDKLYLDLEASKHPAR